MRFLKYAAIVLVIVAIVATVVYLRRDSIARDIANSVLGDTDVTVTDVSLDTLQADRVEFSEIVLELSSGSRIEINGLAFPLSFPSVRPEHVSIERIEMTVPDADAAPSSYEEVLATVLDLPQTVPSTAVTVAELSLPNLPAVTNIVWASATDLQRLSLHALSADVTIEVIRLDTSQHRATLLASDPSVADTLSLVIDVMREESGFRIGGTVAMNTLPWLPKLRDLEFAPARLETLDADLSGPVEIVLDDGGPGRLSAGATLSAAQAMVAGYRLEDGPLIALRVRDATPIAVEFSYPSLAWGAVVERSELLVDAFGIDQLPLAVSDFECRSGIRCTMDLNLDAGPVQWGETGVATVSVAMSAIVTMDETTELEVPPAFALTLTGVRSPALSAESILVTGFAGARLAVVDDGWLADIDELELVLEQVTDRESLTATLPVSLSDIRVRDSAGSIRSMLAVPSGEGNLSWGKLSLRTPGIDGELVFDGESMHAAVELADDAGAVSANLDVTYDLAARAGTAGLRDATLSFDRQRLSERVADWPYDWDIVAGAFTADLDLRWTSGDDGVEFGGSMDHRADGLAGKYDDIVFAGLDARIVGSFDSAPSLLLSPSRIDLALLEIGTPLEDLTTEFSIDAERTLAVDSLSMAGLGGQIAADPFLFNADAETNEFILRLKSVQLQFMADLLGSDDIEVDGSLSGMLPVSIQGRTITIADGRLENDPPGGVMRYDAGAALDAAAPEAGLGVVSQALGNFEFDALTSDVNYTESGDLILKMRLSGINPDVDPNQPVILNLSIENNIPQLLRSLQAIRSIEDVLERKTIN